jgi:hypothetical protein
MGLWDYITPFFGTTGTPEYSLPERSLNDLKKLTNIVFVDDKEFEVVQILKNAGWNNTCLINDVDSVDARQIQEAHIIFVDIQGVGKKLRFQEEGLGLVSALRDKYPTKKLIIYSAESTGDRFHKALSDADTTLRKNADPYQFQTIVEDFSREAFTLEACVSRLQKRLSSEFGLHLNEDEIINNLKKLGNDDDYSVGKVESIFNLENAASIASIISLFMGGPTN